MEYIMKVHIGPYTDYIGPYQIAEKIFFWVNHRAVLLDETLENRWDVKACNKFGDWLDNSWVHKFCLWLDSKKQRKIDVRIDSYDTWSMDHTLALIIHPMLVQLRDTNHGYFSSDPEDAPHIGQDEGTDFTNDSKALDRYKWIMDEMIWTFDTLKTDEDYKLFYTEENGWDFEGQRLHNERMQNGLRLFGKYFRALWD
jgi:hypothetical protein